LLISLITTGYYFFYSSAAPFAFSFTGVSVSPFSSSSPFLSPWFFLLCLYNFFLRFFFCLAVRPSNFAPLPSFSSSSSAAVFAAATDSG
jgi:hypothetical protein